MSKLLFALPLIFGAPVGFATQTVDLKAGASVTLDKLADMTLITCESQAPVTPKCLCAFRSASSSSQKSYDLILYPQKVVLDTFWADRTVCVNAAQTYPECK
jgi:hypothetical protein